MHRVRTDSLNRFETAIASTGLAGIVTIATTVTFFGVSYTLANGTVSYSVAPLPATSRSGDRAASTGQFTVPSRQFWAGVTAAGPFAGHYAVRRVITLR